MVAFERIVVNIQPDSYYNPSEHLHTTSISDICGHSVSRASVGQPSTGPNSPYTSCNSSTSITDYHDKVAIENNISWADQMNMDTDPVNAELPNSLPLTSTHEAAHNPTQTNVNGSSPPIPTPSVLLYDVNQPTDPSIWDGKSGSLSIFGTKEHFP